MDPSVLELFLLFGNNDKKPTFPDVEPVPAWLPDSSWAEPGGSMAEVSRTGQDLWDFPNNASELTMLIHKS